MNLSLLFLLPNQFRHQLMFVCPTCQGQTFTPSTTDLGHLRCSHCGAVHNAQQADFEILSPAAPRQVPPGHKPGPTSPKWW
jgi:hypothetical protein